MNNNIVLFKSTGEGYEITTINENGDVITIKEESPLKAVYVKDVLKRIGE